MSRDARGEGALFEIELDMPRVLGLALALAILLSASYCAGRASGGPESSRGNPFERIVSAGVETEARELDEESLFDRIGAGGSEAAPDRQVTRAAPRGEFELDLGLAASREDADSAKARLESAGIPAFVTTAARGGYRLAAGPYRSEDEAVLAAESIESRFGVTAKLRKASP